MMQRNKFYPDLPEKSGSLDLPRDLPGDLPENSSNFRLQKSREALARLEKEAIHYHNVRKKYKRYYNILSKISVSTGTLSFILSSSVVGVSLTGVGIAIGASVGVTGLICGIASVTTASGAKTVSKKVIKHEKTLAICESKVNSIKDRIFKALRDNKISDEEFSSILSEVDKYNELKSAIRAKYRRSKEANEAYVEDFKKQIRSELMEKLKGDTT